MNENIFRMTLRGRDIILIGTAYISCESINDVNAIIREEKPSMVCVELDQERFNSIFQKETWEQINLSKIIKEHKGFLLIANLILSNFQRRLGNDPEACPGNEMKKAIETSREMGIPIRLCDREIQITFRRAWAFCGLWNKRRFLSALFLGIFSRKKFSLEEIEKLGKNSAFNGMMNKLAWHVPAVKEILLDEQHQYLSVKIWDAIREVPPSSPETKHSVAAVVESGQLQKIKTYLQDMASGEKNYDISKLDIIPPKNPGSRIAIWIIPLVFISLFTIGFIKADLSMLKNMLFYYVLWNGSLAAIGCAAALGHPLAVLISFIGAPITTTFLPYIGIGFFAGLVQAALFKPRVCDVQNIYFDITGLKGIYRNRITRALLVYFMSNIGSIAGTFVSIPAISRLLGD